MTPTFNILITSLSGKVPLIREVRKALTRISPTGKLFGADGNDQCIGKYFVDDFWQMPPTDGLDPAEVAYYCRNHHIRAIIPTRDGELQFFSDHQDFFQHQDIRVMISPPQGVQACLDKLHFYDALKKQPGVIPVPTYDYPDIEFGERWVIKERFGTGSKNIFLNISTKEACAVAAHFESPIYQPYINGREYSIDLYISQSHDPKGCVVRSRDVILNGESQVTTTVQHPDIAEVCLRAAAILDLTGHVLFQILEEASGNLQILECNCRFGGASTLSIAAGLDSFFWFLRECRDDDLTDIVFVNSRPGLRQVRYAEDKIIEMVQ